MLQQGTLGEQFFIFASHQIRFIEFAQLKIQQVKTLQASSLSFLQFLQLLLQLLNLVIVTSVRVQLRVKTGKTVKKG